MPISAIGSSIKLARTGLAALEMKASLFVNFWVRWLIARTTVHQSSVSRANHNPGSRNPFQLARYISATFIPDCDYNAQARGFYSLIADISDRKQTEDALRQSEANYRNLVQTANSVIIRYADTDSIPERLWTEIFLAEEHQILGRTLLETIVPETETSGRDLKQFVHNLFHNPKST